MLPEIGDIGSQPVRPDAPAGDDASDGETYSALEAEINKQVDFYTDAAPDWNRVIDLTTRIIRDESKDLGAGVYLVIGLTVVHGSPGLVLGICVLRDLITTYWSSMYPPLRRLRKRHNQLTWLLDELRKLLDGDLAPLPADEHARLQSAWADLDTFLAENDEDAPVLSRLRDHLAAIAIEPDEKPEEPAAAGSDSEPGSASAEGDTSAVTTSSPAAGGGAPLSVPVAPIDVPESGDLDLETATRPLYTALGDLVSRCLDRSLSEPLLYRLNRQAAWTFLIRLPPASNGATAIPDPNFQVMDQLGKVVAGNDPEAIIRFAEAQLPQFPFWLDLSRLSHQSLTHLEAHDAAAVVAAETLGLMQRLAGLEKLTFRDGTPFADPQTRDWLSRNQPRNGGMAATAANGSAAVPAETVKNEEKAADLAAQGRLDDAIALLEAARSRSSPSGAARTRLRVCQLIRRYRPDVDISPWLSPLMNDLEHYALETWDPGLSAEILSLAIEVADSEARPAVLARLAAVDPVAAWAVAKAG